MLICTWSVTGAQIWLWPLGLLWKVLRRDKPFLALHSHPLTSDLVTYLLRKVTRYSAARISSCSENLWALMSELSAEPLSSETKNSRFHLQWRWFKQSPKIWKPQVDRRSRLSTSTSHQIAWPLPQPYQHIKAAAHMSFKLVILRKKNSLQQSWLCTESAVGFSSLACCCISTWHSQRKVHFILHPSASLTSRFHIRAWNTTYQGQGTRKKCERFKQEFPSLHFYPGRMHLRYCSGRGKIFPELPKKLLQSGSKFSSLCSF